MASVSVPKERIEQAVLLVRGHKVMLDTDLAALYGVPVKRLNEQVRRNPRRFPPDFMFQLNPEEHRALRSQFATLKNPRGAHRKYAPLAFTEQGIAMLSSVLHIERAIDVNIEIVRVFVRLRQFLATHQALSRQLEDLQTKYDGQFKIVFEAIQQLLAVPDPPKRRIGFHLPGKPAA